ncbi:MAG: class I SAM-dependent methyltransferase, partial [Thermoanaerobaculia bacterium]
PTLLERATSEIVAQLEAWQVLGKEKTVLDLGCGIGRIACAIAPMVRDVHGIDVSKGMIDIARKRCEPQTNVHLLKTTGHDLRDFSDEMFDTVIAVDTFPYINQSGAALVESHFSEMRRVLKSGGDLVILNYSYRGDDAADLHDVRRLGTEYGFDVVTAGEHPFSIWNGSAFHLRKRGARRA